MEEVEAGWKLLQRRLIVDGKVHTNVIPIWGFASSSVRFSFCCLYLFLLELRFFRGLSTPTEKIVQQKIPIQGENQMQIKKKI